MTPPRRPNLTGVAAILAGAAFVSMTAVRLATPSPVAAAACGIPTCTLTVLSQGNGSGSFKTTSSSGVPNGFIDCVMVNGVRTSGSVCSHVYGGEDRATPLVIYYAITPATGSIGCSISGSVCIPGPVSGQFTMSSDYQVIEKFTLNTFGIQVGKTGTGTGTITSTPAGINCGGTCAASFNYGTELTLTAMPDAGAYFAGWTGPCSGQDSTCSFSVSQLVLTNAVFQFGTAPTPSPSPGATPATTPHATTAPTPKASKAPATTAPGATLAPPSAPAASDPSIPSATAGDGPSMPIASPEPSAASAPSAAPVASPPTTPTAGTNESPIALAILGAGLLIALAIGVVGFAAMRRRAA